MSLLINELDLQIEGKGKYSNLNLAIIAAVCTEAWLYVFSCISQLESIDKEKCFWSPHDQ